MPTDKELMQLKPHLPNHKEITMTDRELEEFITHGETGFVPMAMVFGEGWAKQAIEIAKEYRARLAQGEPEPVAWVENDGELVWHNQTAAIGKNLYTTPPQRKEEPEPVAWTERELELIDGMIEVQAIHAERCDAIPNRAMAEKQKAWNMERVELLRKIRNTDPPQREWQGLTDEEIEKLFVWQEWSEDFADYEPVARAIEAKLKEKNK